MICPKCKRVIDNCLVGSFYCSKRTEIIEETGKEIPIVIYLTISNKYYCYFCATEIITNKVISYFPKKS